MRIIKNSILCCFLVSFICGSYEEVDRAWCETLNWDGEGIPLMNVDMAIKKSTSPIKFHVWTKSLLDSNYSTASNWSIDTLPGVEHLNYKDESAYG